MTSELSQEPTTLQMIPLSRITERLPVRRLSPSGVTRLKESIQRSGFLENYPLTVLLLDESKVRLLDGNHRLACGGGNKETEKDGGGGHACLFGRSLDPLCTSRGPK